MRILSVIAFAAFALSTFASPPDTSPGIAETKRPSLAASLDYSAPIVPVAELMKLDARTSVVFVAQSEPDPLPFDIAYMVSLSGRQYALVSMGFGPDKPINLSLAWNYGPAGGYDTLTKNPVGGLGAWVTWSDLNSPLQAKVGAYLLAQNGVPADASLSFSLGKRF